MTCSSFISMSSPIIPGSSRGHWSLSGVPSCTEMTLHISHDDIAGPLWGESISHQWIPLTKGRWPLIYHMMTSLALCEGNPSLVDSLHKWPMIGYITEWGDAMSCKGFQHYCSFGNPLVTSGFPHKGPVMMSCLTHSQLISDLRLHDTHGKSL